MEIIVVMAILSIMFVAIIPLFPKMVTYFQHMQANQLSKMQARTCMNTIVAALRNGKANSVVISTPNTATYIPNSRIDFQLASTLTSGTSAYSIYVDNGNVSLQSFPGGGITTLASHVSALMFTGDSRDPSIVNVSLRMDVPLDASGDPSHVLTMILPTQNVRMVTTQ